MDRGRRIGLKQFFRWDDTGTQEGDILLWPRGGRPLVRWRPIRGFIIRGLWRGVACHCRPPCRAGGWLDGRAEKGARVNVRYGAPDPPGGVARCAASVTITHAASVETLIGTPTRGGGSPSALPTVVRPKSASYDNRSTIENPPASAAADRESKVPTKVERTEGNRLSIQHIYV